MLACDVLCIVYATNLHNEAFIFWNLNLLSRNINISFSDIKLPHRFYANYHINKCNTTIFQKSQDIA